MFFQLNKWFLLVSLFLLWSSCSDDTEYEIVNSDEILPQSQGTYTYEEDSIELDEVELSSTQRTLSQIFSTIDFDSENILKEREILFMPNRLGFTDKEEIYFTNDSIPYHFIEWVFEDSLKTVNAFYNWMDCFGNKCNSVRINEEINANKEAFVIWISNNKISYLSSTKTIKRRIYQDVLLNNEEKKWNYILQQAPRGKINWVVSSTPKIEDEAEEK
ncbi:hypothetical protein [Brumimicrobium mesophilum]|uniref:hypothetical protein n=1 Tax=Brumimicrobium mesophilum TaxID=392717 RepID=UPI000D144459|nr:hypothetical protein [Brumimicrobium mesophilum]